MSREELHIGIVGAGDFAAFAIQAFLNVPDVRVVAVTDIRADAAEKMSGQYHLKICADLQELVASDHVDLIYISTPPYLHYKQSEMALLAGKHVICEKPAALKTNEAAALAALAKSRDLLYVVNLMQRYNPLFEMVNAIIREKIIGNFVHGFFENYASDEKLNTDHWFWRESMSGGIFIEHGVHFFDLFSGWLGDGKVANALQLQRSVDDRIVDRVQAAVRYRNGVVNFYHGFNQPGILDRQEMRLQFEYGEITLYEWIPVKLKLYGLIEKNKTEKLQEIMGSNSIAHLHNLLGENQKPAGRFNKIPFEDLITMEYKSRSGKKNMYQQMLTSMLSDQLAWLNDRHHIRIIDDSHAIRSLHMAEEANRLAQNCND
ncbi:MAG TPA: Gfo/Idh/MocA family oxidoreductase [Puia sp.]|nr:Gfo/Idh/MocA family oxidoreductase [Puia sp.]